MCYALSGNGQTCVQYYPAFTSSGAPVSTLGQCGLANIDPGHVLNPATCTTSNGQTSCLSYNGTLSGAETDMYLYVTSAQDSECAAGEASPAHVVTAV